MRIVAVADTHLFTDDLVMPPGDTLIVAGDFCRGGELGEVAEFSVWLGGQDYKHKLVVAGNHDGAFEQDRDEAVRHLPEGVVYLEDSGVILDGLRFWGSPWQPAFHDWAFNLPRGAALAEKWARIPEGLDVLITHSPPAGFGDGTPVGGRHGCTDLLERVRAVRPRLHLFGHIHQDGGLWRDGAVTLVNCTTWECERGPTVIDVDASAVTPVAVPPREGR